MRQADTLYTQPGTDPNTPGGFPRLLTLRRYPNNLPHQLSSFIGREREMAEVKRLLTTTRLLTLTGPGGSGKTRLAIQVATDLISEFADGVWLVELAPLSDPALVLPAVASVLGVLEQPGRPLIETLADHLEPRELLLVLDNCEQLVEACAQLVERLLRLCCLNLRILATSREALGVRGEIAWLVPPLSVPDLENLCGGTEDHPPREAEGTHTASTPDLVPILMQYEATRLFAERASAALPTFALTAHNAITVAQVCCRLDGIPLAIELAAARVKVLSVEQIAARLDDRFNLLTDGSRTAPPRHQTLHATMDWSYALLSEAERALLRRLSTFVGGFTLEAAQAVCAEQAGQAATPSVPYQVLDLLSHLVDKSLVIVEHHDQQARYRLLETTRQYARQLLESGEAGQIRGRHLDYFLGLAEEAEPKLLGAEQVTWFNQLETEHDNLRAAMEWSLQDGEIEKGLRLAGALWWLWYMRGHVSEGRNRLIEVLTRPEAAGRTAARAKALNAAGFLQGVIDNQTEARPLLEEALAIGRELGDPRSIATSLRFLGSVATNLGDYAAAQSFLEEGLEIWRQLGPTARHGAAGSLICLGDLALVRGNYEQAQTLYGESAILLQVVDKSFLADPFRRMAHVALHQGDWQKATVLCKESLNLNLEVGHKPGIAACLASLAEIAAARGRTIHAAQLFGAVEALFDDATQLLPADRTEYHRNVASTRAQLGQAAFEAAWTEGAAMTLEQTIAFASTEPETLLKEEALAPSLSPLQAAKEQFDGLTAREREVAVLVAQGKSNRDIAETLVVSERTAAAHIGNILSKLEFTSRTQIATWAIEKGLVAPSTNRSLSER